MSKTISKSNLPAFKFFPEISEEEFSEIYSLYIDSHRWFMDLPMSGGIPYARAVSIYNQFGKIFNFFEGFTKQHPECSGWFADEMRICRNLTVKAFRGTGKSIDLKVWEALRRYIDAARDIAKNLMMLFAHQGLYVEGEYKFGFSKVPKLLLVSEERYKKEYEKELYDVKVADVINLISEGVRYEVVVQSEESFGMYAFSIFPVNRKNNFFGLEADVTDYSKKKSYSYILNGYNDGEKKAFAFRAGHECTGRNCRYADSSHRITVCTANAGECPDGNYREVFLAVLAALKDYLTVKESIKNEQTEKIFSDTDPIPKYFDKDGIRVYEYYTGKDYIATLKFTGEGRSGYEVRSHVRRGYMRYNPKTGEKDIAVRACIIHKENYEGFETADRINT